MPVVQQLLESERLRREVGQIAVPLGLCTEPSNVKAGGLTLRQLEHNLKTRLKPR